VDRRSTERGFTDNIKSAGHLYKITVRSTAAGERVDPVDTAVTHPVTFDGPAVDFLEGALLGNGGFGAVVTTRPDALVLRFGHNSVWDQRVAEGHWEEVGTFREVFETVERLSGEVDDVTDTEWFREYRSVARESYEKRYPRPYPCGSLLLGFDSRRVEVLGHEVDISVSRCRVELLVDGATRYVDFIVTPDRDRLWLRVVDVDERPVIAPFDRVQLVPDPETPEAFPKPLVLGDFGREMSGDSLDAIGFYQWLPKSTTDPGSAHPNDRQVAVTAGFSAALDDDQRLVEHDETRVMDGLEQAPVGDGPFHGWVDLAQGRADDVTGPTGLPSRTNPTGTAGRPRRTGRDGTGRPTGNSRGFASRTTCSRPSRTGTSTSSTARSRRESGARDCSPTGVTRTSASRGTAITTGTTTCNSRSGSRSRATTSTTTGRTST
jgi:hypothetical protein